MNAGVSFLLLVYIPCLVWLKVWLIDWYDTEGARSLQENRVWGSEGVDEETDDHTRCR
jgi:hypothetical protein